MRKHIYALDGVRFLAAFAVLLFHLVFYAWASIDSSIEDMFDHAIAYKRLVGFSWFGWVGVEVFFVLSGFVIALTANNRTPIDFAKSRALRLYPAAWICATISLLAWMIIGGESFAALLDNYERSIALWIAGPWIDGVYWTLAIEIVFYAVVFLLLLFGGFKRISWVAWGLTALSCFYLWPTIGFHYQFPNGGILETIRYHADLLLLRHGAFFALGIWMWLWSRRRMTPLHWAGVAIAALCACTEIAARSHELITQEVTVRLHNSAALPMTVWLGAVAFMFLAVRAPERFTPRSLKMQRLLHHLGLMTYPLYLVHSEAGAGVLKLLLKTGMHRWWALALAIMIALATSYAIARLAEPIARKGLRWVWERGEAMLRGVKPLSFLFKPGGQIPERPAPPPTPPTGAAAPPL